jgi:hypothetical protein
LPKRRDITLIPNWNYFSARDVRCGRGSLVVVFPIQ